MADNASDDSLHLDEEKLRMWDPFQWGASKHTLYMIHDLKDLLPPDLELHYGKEIEQMQGSPGRALFANTVAFASGFVILAVFGPAIFECEVLEPFPKGLLVACPTISGSAFRLPFGPNIGRTGGLVMTSWFLLWGEIGMGMIAVLSWW